MQPAADPRAPEPTMSSPTLPESTMPGLTSAGQWVPGSGPTARRRTAGPPGSTNSGRPLIAAAARRSSRDRTGGDSALGGPDPGRGGVRLEGGRRGTGAAARPRLTAATLHLRASGNRAARWSATPRGRAPGSLGSPRPSPPRPAAPHRATPAAPSVRRSPRGATGRGLEAASGVARAGDGDRGGVAEGPGRLVRRRRRHRTGRVPPVTVCGLEAEVEAARAVGPAARAVDRRRRRVRWGVGVRARSTGSRGHPGDRRR